MNHALVENINALVAPTDQLYVLGDFSFRITSAQAAAIRKKIRCRRVHLVPGNHDKDWTNADVADTFIVEPHIVQLKEQDRKLVLCHYPLMDWPGMAGGTILLHGHIHSQGPAYNDANLQQGIFRMDVGVDANGYRPVSLDQVLKRFEGAEYRGRIKWPEWVWLS